VSELASAVVSVTRTARGRFFWAAWWTGAPSLAPFRKPDASNGGASSHEDALKDAERVAARHLSETEPYWARAVNRMLRGEPPPPMPKAKSPRERSSASAAPRSAWQVLGLEKGASLAAIKRAHRAHALSTHPDRGGDPEAFLEVQRAYERLLRRKR
jgi:hypothetical protein